MKQKVSNTLKNNSLFIKMFLITAISIVSVSLLITFSSLRMASDLFTDTFSITNMKVLNQIETRFELYSFAIVSAANDVQNNGTIKRGLTNSNENAVETARSNHSIIEQMERIYRNIESYNANMIVLGDEERLYNMNYSNWPISWEALKDNAITQSAINSPRTLQYEFIPSNTFTNKPMIVATKALMERSTDYVYGVLYFPIREEQLKEFYEEYTSRGNEVLLINEQGTIISSNQDELVGVNAMDVLNLAKEVELEELEYKDVHVFDREYMLMSEYLPTYNMYLVNLVDRSVLMNNLVNPTEIIMISVGIVLLAVMVVFVISRRMTKSISELVNQISDMAKYDFNKPVTETGGYEAKKIADSFNFMLNELQEYVDLVVQTQKKQRTAELRALQHQINPHFLYNTLTSVKFMVQQGKKEKATDTIHALISLLQSSLSNINQTITVEEEIKNLKDYVLINQSRYGEQIKVNYFISPDCLDYHLPKLVLQPFIENAFFHGFNKKKEGFIQILIAKKSEFLVCEVIDNGDGMEMEGNQIKVNLKGKRHLFSGIGVRNVHERIQLLYGNQYGVELTSAKGEGTRVKVELPLQKG